MTGQTDILCIGSVLWDVIGRSPQVMRAGNDVPGRITRIPGGVAMNIAMTLVRFDMQPSLLTVVGQDSAGRTLLEECARMGLNTDHVLQDADLPTDQYMAIEGANGLIAAIADAHSLEAAGARILTPLTDGPLGHVDAPYSGIIALDGNLTLGLLTEISGHPAFAKADLRIAPASPGKAERLLPFVQQGRGTLYVNLEEAGYLCDRVFTDASDAAVALVTAGSHRALVTDGPRSCADATQSGVISATPPCVSAKRITGAGDTFMAAHIAAEFHGETRQNSLTKALQSAAAYVSGEQPE
ncbi:MAG: PfkB family carbohydrate kinase [Pelagimonas sp.]|jgi:sugar/nucleoside kinase (ribokinase family)|nr:PfkB family carbohydrate kinase [Pelagimonas sp.]